jgi:proteasome accessory factor A
MNRRIYGLENEYGLISSMGGKISLSEDRTLGYLFENLSTRQRSTNVFLKNGARLYQDTGGHPEYATPECTNALDLITYDKAGERILEELGEAAESRLAAEGLAIRIYLFKNNTDSAGNTYGCHENYLVDRDVNFQKMAELLIPFFVTRQVYAGAGKVLKTPCGYHFFISQRAQHIYQKISGATTCFRSIINTRDEPHADAERYRRLHVIVGDSNMSEVASYLKTGATGIVLSMLEDGFLTSKLILRDPVRAIREISYDASLKKKIKLDRGLEFTAVEIQKEYHNLATDYFKNNEADEVTSDILKRWGSVLERLDAEPESLVREVDWVAKKNLLNSFMKKRKTGWDDQRIAMMDLQYHNIRQDRSFYYLLQGKGLLERVLSEKVIANAIEFPPQDTRAKLRGDFIRRANEKCKSYSVDWSYLKVNDRYQRTVICKDPFRHSDLRVQEMLSSL